MSASDALVSLDGASRTFGTGPGAVVAVHDVSGRVFAGNEIALTGPSGSGKTTLLHLIAGLDQPTRGTVTWPAIGSIGSLRPGPIAVVFQAPSLLPALDVTENVALPLLLEGRAPDEAAAAANRALTTLDLAALSDKLPEELSGGQAQRVAIARSLAGRPRLILADEPTGQLDHHNADAVVDALLAAVEDSGAALLVNTHDREVAARLPIRWTMSNGSLLEPEDARC